MSAHLSNARETTTSTVEEGATDGIRLGRAVLLTVLYADLFDYPLTREELHRRLIACTVSKNQLDRTVDALTESHLERVDDFITWKGREHLVERRLRHEECSRALWPVAERYGERLRWVPFLRMVAVSGSLAISNASSGSDIDLFCVTDDRRLWVSRLWLVVISRATRLFSGIFPRYMCPNYLLTLQSLRLKDRNLFTAYEAIQAVPLWGGDVYHRFVQANLWTGAYLPQSRDRESGDLLDQRPKPWLVRGFEWLLSGKAGDMLDRLVYRIFVAGYRARAEGRGWTWSRLQDAYRRERYTVPEGGYTRVIGHYFRQRVRNRLDEGISGCRLSWLFPGIREPEPETCYDWENLFQEAYGPQEKRDHNHSESHAHG